MRSRWSMLLLLSAVTGCGGPGGTSGGTGPVSAPAPPSALPPEVYVGGPEAPGGFLAWNGSVSFTEATGADTLQLQLTQTGAAVSGTLLVFGPDGKSGPFAGTISGSTLYFNFSVGHQGQGCGNAISGTATVSAHSMVGTFSGHDCKGGSVTNGEFTVVPPVDTIDSTRLPVSGTWKGTIPSLPGLGGGAWTWVVTQEGDVSGGSLHGSVSVTSGNALNLDAGTFTGTLTNRFPGPAWYDRVVLQASFDGACASTFHLNLALVPDGGVLSGSMSGSSCGGSVPATGVSLERQ